MMKEEKKHMKYLKIEDNKGFFLKDLNVESPFYVPIDQITRDDLLPMLNKAISEEFEMDEFREELVSNKAHQIIYKNLYEKFAELLSEKSRFKDESEGLYKNAFDKYTIHDVSSEGDVTTQGS
jgi:hypothetical protein